MNIQKRVAAISVYLLGMPMLSAVCFGQVPGPAGHASEHRRKAVAVQLFHQNRLVDQDRTPPSRERWWERYTPSMGHLRPPQQTPWSLTAFERYEEAKQVQ
jgi:hypothetical protein